MLISESRIIVTGAASGLGRSAAQFLDANGAKVAAFDINAKGLDSLSKESEGRIKTFVVDISKEDDVVGGVKRAERECGGLNGLINFAGIYLDGALTRPGGVKMPLAQWKRVIDVDLTGTFLMVREVANAMIVSSSPGVIITVASISRHGNVGQSNYSAAKAGVVADTRVWARELAPYGIRAASLSPGLFDTPILRALDPKALAAYLERIPLGRLGKPDELNTAVRFLIECDYFTGECLEVNGGFLF